MLNDKLECKKLKFDETIIINQHKNLKKKYITASLKK